MDARSKACLSIILHFALKRNVRRKRWVKEWLLKRDQYTHLNLLNEILITDTSDYHNYFRMSAETFQLLVKMVEPYLVRKSTAMRGCISVEERLALTLRYLATGRNFEDLKFSVIMSTSTISNAILETCEVLVTVLQEYIKVSL